MGHPRFGIENRATGQREFTVTLPTCCFNAYNCTDVVYDVHGKINIIPTRVKQTRLSSDNAVCVRLTLILTQPLLYLFQIILEIWWRLSPSGGLVE